MSSFLTAHQHVIGYFRTYSKEVVQSRQKNLSVVKTDSSRNSSVVGKLWEKPDGEDANNDQQQQGNVTALLPATSAKDMVHSIH